MNVRLVVVNISDNIAKQFDEYPGKPYSDEWLYALLHDRYKYENGDLIRIKVYHSRHNYLLGLPYGRGKCDNNGYRQGGVWNRRFRLHRLIFLYHHGYLPKIVDHINRDHQDNRIENLRKANDEQSTLNTKIKNTNKSGHKGVHYNKLRNRWIVQAKGKHYGSFESKDDAIEKAKEVQREIYDAEFFFEG